MKFLKALLALLEQIFMRPAYDVNPKTLPMNEETNREKLLEAIRQSLGSDASPHDAAKDEYGCAESVSNIIAKVYDFPITTSTVELANILDKHPHFKRTTIPKPACVIVSPRKDAIYGHAGFLLTNSRIASNDSATGLMQDNYSWGGWVVAFKDRKNLRILLWEPL